MNLLQSWLVVGVPALAVALGLFSGRDKVRAWAGYGLLAALLAFFVLVPGDPISAVVPGVIAVAFLAVGRGTRRDDEYAEHHEGRRALTTTPSEMESTPEG